MKKNMNAWKVGKDGNTYFNGRREGLKNESSYSNMWENPRIALVIMLFCCGIDFAMFKGVLGSFLNDHIVIQWFSIAALLAAFDVGPIYGGNYLKKKKQGYNCDSIILYICIAAFAIAFIGNFALRIKARDIMMPPETTTGTSTFGSLDTGSVQESNPMAMIWAVFGAVLPLVTSMISFIVSYAASNPLKQERVQLAETAIDIEESIQQIEAALAENDADPDFLARLQGEDRAKYEIALEMTKKMALTYTDYVRERLKEHIGEPVSINQLSLAKHHELAEVFDVDVTPYVEGVA